MKLTFKRKRCVVDQSDTLRDYMTLYWLIMRYSVVFTWGGGVGGGVFSLLSLMSLHHCSRPVLLSQRGFPWSADWTQSNLHATFRSKYFPRPCLVWLNWPQSGLGRAADSRSCLSLFGQLSFGEKERSLSPLTVEEILEYSHCLECVPGTYSESM